MIVAVSILPIAEALVEQVSAVTAPLLAVASIAGNVVLALPAAVQYSLVMHCEHRSPAQVLQCQVIEQSGVGVRAVLFGLRCLLFRVKFFVNFDLHCKHFCCTPYVVLRQRLGA